MKTSLATITLAASVVFASSHLAVGQSYNTLDAYLKANGMIRVPTALQNKVLPGSLLIIKWKRNVLGQYKHLGTEVYRTRIDVDEPTFKGQVVTGTITDNKAFQLGGGASLGPLTPSVQLTRTSDLTYTGTEFASSEWDGGDIDDLLAKSTLTQNVVKSYSIGGSNPTVLDGAYQIFLVESVFAASSVNLTSSSNQKLTLRNGSATGDCTAKATPAPGATPPAATAAPAVAGAVGADGAAAKPAASPDAKSDANAVPLYPVHVELCFAGNHSYVLNHTPPVPLGMSVMEVKYRNGHLESDIPDPKDLQF